MATKVSTLGDFLKIEIEGGETHYFRKAYTAIKFMATHVDLADAQLSVSVNIEFTDFENGTGTAYTTEATIMAYLADIMSPLNDIGINTGGTSGAVEVNKFGINAAIDTGTEELLATYGGAFLPANIMTTAQTFTITYTDTLDGATAAGVRVLGITYIDENYEEQTAIHVLGSDGSDVTAFTGFGINRVYAYTFGSTNVTGANIDLTATIDATLQARIPAGDAVTKQCVYHVPINKQFKLYYMNMNVRKLAGGGGDPEVVFKLYSYSRITFGKYNVDEQVVDGNNSNNLELTFPQPIIFGGREVIFLTATTDINNTSSFARFSGQLTDV